MFPSITHQLEAEIEGQVVDRINFRDSDEERSDLGIDVLKLRIDDDRTHAVGWGYIGFLFAINDSINLVEGSGGRVGFSNCLGKSIFRMLFKGGWI